MGFKRGCHPWGGGVKLRGCEEKGREGGEHVERERRAERMRDQGG